tara:strand:+ start:13457 stop:13798 length:342 start_codon:yes stop_codon:yes gene_type:complete
MKRNEFTDVVDSYLREKMPEQVVAAKELLGEFEAMRVMGREHRAITQTQELLMRGIHDKLALALMDMQHLAGSIASQRATEMAERLDRTPVVSLGSGNFKLELHDDGQWRHVG